MIKTYALDNHRRLRESSKSSRFIYLVEPKNEEISQISNAFDFPTDYLSGVQDDYENARFEVDADGNRLLLIQYPVRPTKDSEVVTMPFSLVWTEENSVILTMDHQIADHVIFSRKYDSRFLSEQIIFQVMTEMVHLFHIHLREFRLRRREIEGSIKKSQKNDQVIELIGMQTSLIYFEDALQNNIEVIEKLIAYLREKKLTRFANGIYDIFIETDQARTETRIQLRLLQNLRDLFTSIVNNNLNIVMKIMTSATFILGIPAIIVGFYGMNVPLPLQEFWWITPMIFISMILVCWAVWKWLRERDMI